MKHLSPVTFYGSTKKGNVLAHTPHGQIDKDFAPEVEKLDDPEDSDDTADVENSDDTADVENPGIPAD